MNDRLWKDGELDLDVASPWATDVTQTYLAHRGNYDEIDSNADALVTCFDGTTMCDVLVTVNVQDDDAPLSEIIDDDYKSLVRCWLQWYAIDNENVERVRADHVKVRVFRDSDGHARLQHLVAIVFGEVDPETRHIEWLDDREW